MRETLKKYFDLRSGIFAALLMGGCVWLINAKYGPLLASTAALKQAAYTFFMGGTIIKFCYHVAGKPRTDSSAIILATVLPTIVTVGATFVVHSLKGTPEPLLSTIPVAVISPPSFFLLARQHRKGLPPTA